MRRLAASLFAILAAATALLASGAPAQAATPSCTVSYLVVNQWSGGFEAQIIVGYSGFQQAFGWTLSFDFTSTGQRIATVWTGNWSQSGEHVTVSSSQSAYSGMVPGSGSVSLGFIGTDTGLNPPPDNFTFDGVPCSTAAPQ